MERAASVPRGTHDHHYYREKGRQQEELRELTGKTGEALELSLQELEERILPEVQRDQLNHNVTGALGARARIP